MNKTNLPLEWIERIFMRLHGRFGNSFLDKYRIGGLNQKGDDVGIENAKQTWAQELAGVSVERIKAALEANYDYPPSCDDFKANCKVKVQQQDYIALPAPNNKETNKAYADNVVQFVLQNETPKSNKRAWIKRILDNPSRWPDISVKYAQEALAMKEVA